MQLRNGNFADADENRSMMSRGQLRQGLSGRVSNYSGLEHDILRLRRQKPPEKVPGAVAGPLKAHRETMMPIRTVAETNG